MRAAVVYNPVKADLAALERALRIAQPAEWDDALWIETAQDDDGRGAVEEALAAGTDVVLVAGGDGTVRMASEVMAGSGVPLALLPAGTGNLLARNLGLDVTFLRASMRTAFDGRDRDIDVGWIEFETPGGDKAKHAFVVIAGFGLDAAMIANTRSELKKRVGWLAYVEGIVKAIHSVHRIRMRYEVDDEPQRTVGLNSLMLGNCGALMGNVVLLPEARIDDGKIDVAMIRPKDLQGWLQVAALVIRNSSPLRRALRRRRLIGPQKTVPTLGYGQCTRFTARLDEPVPVQIDGDAFGDAIAMRVTVQRGALRVRVPHRLPLARPIG